MDKPLVGNFFDDVREDFVIYREGTTGAPQSQFLIKQAGGVGNWTIDWGLKDDVPMIGRFYPNTRAQIVIWRPSTGDFWAYNPNTNTYTAWHWGQTGDIPFVGNFFDESGSVSGNNDEVAVYRPSDKTFYIYNPRSGQDWYRSRPLRTTTAKYRSGTFWASGTIRSRSIKRDVWNIIDPRTRNHLHR